MASSGYIGIGTTSNINSALTLGGASFITVDSDNEYIGISGGDSQTGGATIILYGENHISSSGSVLVSASMFVLDGEMLLSNTSASSNATTGALVVDGGISIMGTDNATSFTSGGSLTSRGGASFEKDLYVGGSITIDGVLTVVGLNSSPILAFSNTDNCTISGYGNSQLALIGSEAVLSFYVNVAPLVANEKVQFEYNVPNRIANFTNRGDIITSCSGWTDDTELYTLYNILSTGVVGGTTALVKFQSTSTTIHNIQIIARYTPS